MPFSSSPSLLSSESTAGQHLRVFRDNANDWLNRDPSGWEVLDEAVNNDLSDFEVNVATPFKNHVAATPITDIKNALPVAQNSPITNKVIATMQPTDNHLPFNDGNAPHVKFDGDTSRANPHFKPLLPKPIHQGESGRQLIMDTETTGLDALKGDRVIEVGIVELVNRKFTGEKLHVYINPQRTMDEEVIRIHGISEAFLADKPIFADVAQPLYDFMLGAEVIAHNAPFDMSFLSMEFNRVGLTDFADKVSVTDSLAMAKQQYPGQKNTLDALVRRLNVGKMDRTFHGALLDSEILAEVYLAMTGGQVSLAIDDEVQALGSGSNAHHNFAHLADKLIKADNDTNEHRNWVSKLITKHPDLAQTQGIACFYKTANDEIFSDLLSQYYKQPDFDTINLTTNLFLSSL